MKSPFVVALLLAACAHAPPPIAAHPDAFDVRATPRDVKRAAYDVLTDRYVKVIGIDTCHVVSEWQCRDTDGDPCSLLPTPGQPLFETKTSPQRVGERRYDMQVVVSFVDDGRGGLDLKIDAQVRISHPGASDNQVTLVAGRDPVPPWVQHEIDTTSSAIRERLAR